MVINDVSGSNNRQHKTVNLGELEKILQGMGQDPIKIYTKKGLSKEQAMVMSTAYLGGRVHLVHYFVGVTRLATMLENIFRLYAF